ncbi:hypothetical protein GCK72_015205 [Caenorhabditis remanei]|uniref:Uncharacterized protein n=1 Tax=Caenorhabditis remanei TaxID=31234 RepID=A0A6A5GW96_CAERE|nr:hypothetical protein GCK72_015205 [Caenorhabditis remanei]KAF1758745.1 hypothetical protein GCK72_015205 [Caenorhabditis remanei]
MPIQLKKPRTNKIPVKVENSDSPSPAEPTNTHHSAHEMPTRMQNSIFEHMMNVLNKELFKGMSENHLNSSNPTLSPMQPGQNRNFAPSASHFNPFGPTAAPIPLNFLAQFMPNCSQTTQMGPQRLPHQYYGNPASGTSLLNATPTSEPPPKRMKHDIESILGIDKQVKTRLPVAENTMKNMEVLVQNVKRIHPNPLGDIVHPKEIEPKKGRMYRKIVENNVKYHKIRKNTPLERMFNDMKKELSWESPDIRLIQKEVTLISIHTGARQCDVIQFFGLKEEPVVTNEGVPQENESRESAMKKQFQKLLEMNVLEYLSTSKNNNPNFTIEHVKIDKEQEMQAKWYLLSKHFGPSQPQSQTQAPLRVPTTVKFADIGKCPVTTNAPPNTSERVSAITLQTKKIMHKMDRFGTTLNTFSHQNSTVTMNKSNTDAQKAQDQKPMEVEANESQRYPDLEASQELEIDEAARALNDLQSMWNTTGTTAETIEKIGKPIAGEYKEPPRNVMEPPVDLKMSNSSKSPVPPSNQDVSIQSSLPHMATAPETSLFVPMKSEISEKSSHNPGELPGAEIFGSAISPILPRKSDGHKMVQSRTEAEVEATGAEFQAMKVPTEKPVWKTEDVQKPIEREGAIEPKTKQETVRSSKKSDGKDVMVPRQEEAMFYNEQSSTTVMPSIQKEATTFGKLSGQSEKQKVLDVKSILESEAKKRMARSSSRQNEKAEAPPASSSNQIAPIMPEKYGRPTNKRLSQLEEQKDSDIQNIGKHKAKIESKTEFSKPERKVAIVSRQEISLASSSNRNAPTTFENLEGSTGKVQRPIGDKQRFVTDKTIAAPGSFSLKRKHEADDEANQRSANQLKIDALREDCVRISKKIKKHVLSKSEHVYDYILKQYHSDLWETLLKQDLSTTNGPELFNPESFPDCEITQKPLKKGELPPCFTEDSIKIACPQCFQLSYTEPEVSQVYRNKVRDSRLYRKRYFWFS